MLNEFKKIQAFFFFVSAIIGATLYVHTTFATTQKVESLDAKINTIGRILCAMAIDQKLPTAKKVCSLQAD